MPLTNLSYFKILLSLYYLCVCTCRCVCVCVCSCAWVKRFNCHSLHIEDRGQIQVHFLTATLLLKKTPLFLYCLSQGSGPPRSLGVHCFCLQSHCRIPEITDVYSSHLRVNLGDINSDLYVFILNIFHSEVFFLSVAEMMFNDLWRSLFLTHSLKFQAGSFSYSLSLFFMKGISYLPFRQQTLKFFLGIHSL